MASCVSLSDGDIVQKLLSGPHLGYLGYLMKVNFCKMAQFSSVRYESALNHGS